MIPTLEIIDPGRAVLKGPILRRKDWLRSESVYGSFSVESPVKADIKAETLRKDFAPHIPAAAAGAVNQRFWATRLRAKVGGITERTVPAHSAVKQNFLNNSFCHSEE